MPAFTSSIVKHNLFDELLLAIGKRVDASQRSPTFCNAALRTRIDYYYVESAARKLAENVRRHAAVTAFLDRLMHHIHVIALRSKSYRFHESSVTARGRKAAAKTY